MPKFKITIEESLRATEVIEAETREEAIEIMEEMWNKAEIVLDSDNFTEMNIINVEELNA